ncbi:MAG: SDR family NAD(P)-dependent oxidoreductase [Actinobacteria bacterium]|nr:SDR family NAD(P)-dependent oxidoreductase [Actinomycetota bacterium]MSY78823.1 SDR family NAD(P)-dependent oxidoreductase [Actinomycetota bacterium]MTA64330.1 SDR family NAD(P)-dependent oxidoreductase [Actinomycetota bacterium]
MGTWTGKRVLVTGGEGFIGSHLVDLLVSEGAQVTVLVYYNSFGRWGWLDTASPQVREAIKILPGDVRDARRVDEAVEGQEVVFHLAALIGIPYSYHAAESYVQTNVTGTFHVAEACRRHGARMIHTSTSEVYGTALRVPIDEDHPLQPQSPYSASKIGADMMALSYFHAHELPVAVVRPFNTYGPRQSTRAVIPTILAQLYSGVSELHLGSISPKRDFNYATDTASGFLALADCDEALGRATNIGSGQEISIGDLVTLLCEITGRSVEITTDEDRLRPTGSEVERLLCDHSVATRISGWTPEVSLVEGLTRTAEWVQSHLVELEAGGYHI